MLLQMIWAAVAAALVGGVAGYLMPGPAYRLSVPEGTRSECAECGEPLRWADVRGQCWSCGVRLGPPAWLPASAAAAACAVLAVALGPRPELPPLMAVTILGVLLGAVDLAAERLPDLLVLPGIGAAVLWYGLLAIATGDWGSYGRALLAGLAYAGIYFVMALLPGGQLGLGDVKLAALLGICLGWFGWALVGVGAALPWLVNAPVAIVLFLRRGPGTSMPFGPSMLAGAFLTLVIVLGSRRAFG